jgi:hypothetical protein
MKLRTFEGEPVRGELTTDPPVSQDGLPVLLVKDEPFSPEEAEFFIEYVTHEELDMFREGGYDLPGWEGSDEGYEEVEEIDFDENWNSGRLVKSRRE